MYRVKDDKIVFDNFSEEIEALPLIDYGSQSDVYKIRVNKKPYALKVFNKLSTIGRENCEPKMKLQIPSFAFPVKLLYAEDRFRGYMMPFFKGPDLSQKRLKNLSINEFAKSSMKLYSDTEELGNNGYTIYNSFISNVIYDQGFRLLSTDNYFFNEKESLSGIKDLNKRRINQLLYDIFVNATGLAKKFYEDVDLTKLKAACNSGKISFEEFINYIAIKAYKSNDEINTLGELGKEIREKTKTK